jgi:hypothetical protein
LTAGGRLTKALTISPIKMEPQFAVTAVGLSTPRAAVQQLRRNSVLTGWSQAMPFSTSTKCERAVIAVYRTA